jgi:hypothetical protein
MDMHTIEAKLNRTNNRFGHLHVEQVLLPRRNHGDRTEIDVTPPRHPDSLFDFVSFLTDVESELEDEGIRVWLRPVILQPMVCVFTAKDVSIQGTSRVRTYIVDAVEGREFVALIEALGTSAIADPQIEEKHAYDNRVERAELVEELLKKYPDAKDLTAQPSASIKQTSD